MLIHPKSCFSVRRTLTPTVAFLQNVPRPVRVDFLVAPTYTQPLRSKQIKFAEKLIFVDLRQLGLCSDPHQERRRGQSAATKKEKAGPHATLKQNTRSERKGPAERKRDDIQSRGKREVKESQKEKGERGNSTKRTPTNIQRERGEPKKSARTNPQRKSERTLYRNKDTNTTNEKYKKEVGMCEGG